MAKQKTKEEIRKELLIQFEQIISSMIVLHPIAKHAIIGAYQDTIVRLSKKNITMKSWTAMGPEDLFSEINEVEIQFRMLEIFSDKFYSLLRSQWNQMLGTFNPHFY